MTTSTPALRALRAVTLFAAIVIATGCARGGPAKQLQAAQETTLNAGSSAFAIEQTLENGPNGNKKIRTEGVLDFAQHAGRATVQMSDGEAEVVFAGDATYLRLPPSVQTPTPWIRIDSEDMKKLSGLDNMSNDPSRNLDLLGGISGDVERIGEEDVRGTRTTRYRFTIDLKQAAEKAPQERREAVQRQAAMLGGGQLPSEIWLDPKGRIARQTFTLDLQKIKPKDTQSPKLSGTIRTLIEFYDFGTKVDAQPPPNNQVTDFEKLTGR
jgi:hypothetical protein